MKTSDKSQRLAQRVAASYLRSKGKTASMKRTAGEVIFRKDNSGDEGAWAYGIPGGTSRQIHNDFKYVAKNMKPLATAMRSTLAALGHAISAQSRFAKIKSVQVSPDGHLGGRGYIQRITDMRRQYMNCVEALSALSDTIYDELTSPHWNAVARKKDPKVKEVTELMDEADEIRKDPQEWADDQMDEEFGD